ncbi:unnamed protein product [Prorocentrum cordatum]|uniref:Steroid 5-alpha reductase C-terminal domain-containing protein n=1 Tax=Prorocentrum cordatum TaxID=2364126 RepID=A0ABN9VA11_9DINO|nr:unnamed protein product [Polarella glacialis]
MREGRQPPLETLHEGARESPAAAGAAEVSRRFRFVLAGRGARAVASCLSQSRASRRLRPQPAEGGADAGERQGAGLCFYCLLGARSQLAEISFTIVEGFSDPLPTIQTPESAKAALAGVFAWRKAAFGSDAGPIAAMSYSLVFGASTAVTAFIQLSGFAAAFALQTEVFYDILGGANFLALAAVSASAASAPGRPWGGCARKVVVTVLFVLSRLWLLIFLAWRAHERGGDSRFDGVKDKFGKFLTFWVVQGVWVMLISMPVLFVNASPVTAELGALDGVLLAGFACGAISEIAGARQAAWVKAGRLGGFCRGGLWSFSRHPNYFGEILQWWCAWAFAFSSGTGTDDWLWWACSVSPLFTMHILLNLPPTGICNAEGKNLARYYQNWPDEYAKYRENTSILIPMIGYRFIPLALKRMFFFEFSKYEYRPDGNRKAD